MTALESRQEIENQTEKRIADMNQLLHHEQEEDHGVRKRLAEIEKSHIELARAYRT